MALTRKSLAEYLTAGAQGDNPFVKGDYALQQQAMENQGRQQLAQQTSQMEEQAANRRFDKARDTVLQDNAKGKHTSASITKEGASYSENQPDPMARLLGATHKEGKDLDAIAQKSVAPLSAQLNQIDLMHRLLDNPSSVDAKQLGAGFARITEGQGQRLLQSLVESMGAPNDVVADSSKALNFLTAAASSPIGSEQHRAMRQNLFKHQSQIQDQLDQGHQQFLQRGGLVAPDLSSDKYETAFRTAAPNPELVNSLRARQDSFNKQLGAPSNPGQPPQAAQPQSLVDKLTSFLRPQAQPQPQQPSNPVASPSLSPTTKTVGGRTYNKNPQTGLWE